MLNYSEGAVGDLITIVQDHTGSCLGILGKSHVMRGFGACVDGQWMDGPRLKVEAQCVCGVFFTILAAPLPFSSVRFPGRSKRDVLTLLVPSPRRMLQAQALVIVIHEDSSAFALLLSLASFHILFTLLLLLVSLITQT